MGAHPVSRFTVKALIMAGKSALPLLVLAGAAAVLMSGKKKKRKSGAGYEEFDYESYAVPPTPPPPAATKTAGPSGESAGSDIWKQRQTALAFVAGMKVCNCHPGNIDGLYGPATLNAIIAFQVCTGIDVDGKWGPQTDAAMKKMLVEIASGKVYIKKPKKSAPLNSDIETWNIKEMMGYLPKNVIDLNIYESFHTYDRKSFIFVEESVDPRYALDIGDRWVEIEIYYGQNDNRNTDILEAMRKIAIAYPHVTFVFKISPANTKEKIGRIGFFFMERLPTDNPSIYNPFYGYAKVINFGQKKFFQIGSITNTESERADMLIPIISPYVPWLRRQTSKFPG